MDGISPGRTVSVLRPAQAAGSPAACREQTATTGSQFRKSQPGGSADNVQSVRSLWLIV